MIRVYFNLHKHLFSVQEKVNGSWKVTRHVDSIFIRDALFKVSEKGRQRVLREKRKNVHAYITGEEYKGDLSYGGQEVYYNPCKTTGFITRAGEMLKKSVFVKMCVIDGKPQVFALGNLFE